ncbi:MULTISPECIES: type IV pilus modification PilV family protein [Burkholderiaceae]|uniref:Uncharacterized protein n=1 Tax=Caballeronia sordidicola TaxID=196367 RepID=A0A242N961_CABSO|nr:MULTISPECIES: hypothetical protein [Burkholderiaceae]OTP80153.1 hypothetical protein PAMC26510_03375 [Caballeronia sordidicola]
MMTFASRFDRGDSLIEVLIALSLCAVTALGIIGAQMWLARTEWSVMMRETAVSIAWFQQQVEITENGEVAHWRRMVAKPFQTSFP